jgi:hypothetical protein
MTRGGPDQSGGHGQGARGVNDKVAQGEARGANRLGPHRGSVDQLVSLDWTVGFR